MELYFETVKGQKCVHNLGFTLHQAIVFVDQLHYLLTMNDVKYSVVDDIFFFSSLRKWGKAEIYFLGSEFHEYSLLQNFINIIGPAKRVWIFMPLLATTQYALGKDRMNFSILEDQKPISYVSWMGF